MCEWAPDEINWAWPRSAELFGWAQTRKRSWVCSLCPPGSRWAIEIPSGCLSTCRIRTGTSFALTFLSHHPPSFTMCLQGMWRATLHFHSSHACDNPWDDVYGEPCHMFQEERQTLSQKNRRDHNYYCASVERPRGLGMVPPPSLETAAGWPCVHLQSQMFLLHIEVALDCSRRCLFICPAVRSKDTDEGHCLHLGVISQCLFI